MDVWGAAATPAATDDDAGAAMVVLLEEGERAALRRVASAGLQLMANLTAGYPEGAARMFEVRQLINHHSTGFFLKFPTSTLPA